MNKKKHGIYRLTLTSLAVLAAVTLLLPVSFAFAQGNGKGGGNGGGGGGEGDPGITFSVVPLDPVNPADARDLFAIAPSMATDLCVYVANPAEIENIAKKIAALLPDTRVLTKNQIQKTYQVIFGWRSGFASICLLTALVAFAILAWDKASGLSPEERREIGILKILGWETGDILAIRFWESGVVSILAYVIGMTAAYIHVAFLGGSLLKPVMLGWSVIHPSFKLLPAVTLGDLLLVFTFSVIPYLGATIVPAWRCSTVPPDSVIR